jgi:hypothetical protein
MRHPIHRDYDGVVDWRTAIRKIVNREEHLGALRLALLRVIDPVEWYMAKNDEERRRSRRTTPNARCGVDRICAVRT